MNTKRIIIISLGLAAAILVILLFINYGGDTRRITSKSEYEKKLDMIEKACADFSNNNISQETKENILFDTAFEINSLKSSISEGERDSLNRKLMLCARDHFKELPSAKNSRTK